MTLPLQLTSHDRVLVFAPHPDDETIATGELIQSALALGACVRVVFATYGDNNPWPQRWLERRWRIGQAERKRWGERRRDEAMAALDILGLGDASTRFLGWPDQGLTACLMRDDSAIDTLAAEISGFAPTHVAMPALGDRHPDHSALRVMLDLALLRSDTACVRLGYIVHGSSTQANPRAVGGNPAWQTVKQRAMLAHASQVALSRRRLLDLAARPERFYIAERADVAPVSITQRSFIRIPQTPKPFQIRREELLLVLATDHDIVRFRIPLARRASTGHPTNEQGQVPEIDWAADALSLTLPATRGPILALYAKRERVGSRLVIFDEEGWRDSAQLSCQAADLVGAQAAASVV